ncbi:MAG: HlyD family efflux transporter periplasmic adaptor subunit [Betaproteobacteria bacterium]|nr:MAG: HlyD family efflux transporter periplasmic adaptor subunit [Betaproteobacteria bacterium]
MPTSPIQEWLDDFCDDSPEVTGGVVALGESDDSAPHVVAVVDANAARPEDLVTAAAESVRKRSPVLLGPEQSEADGEPTPAVASVPLRMGEKAVGAIALELHQDSSESPQSALAGLEQVADKFATALLIEADQRSTADAARVLQVQATLLTHENFLEAATALATELANVLRLDHVAIGFRDGAYSRVEAVSNFADFEEDAQVFRITSIAMDEAIEQGASVAYPGIPDDRPRINVAQAQLAKRHSCVVCSIPIVDRGHAIGAVTIERAGETPFSMQEVAEYEQIMCIVGPVLGLKRESERPWQWRLKKSFLRVAERFLGPGHVFAKSSAIASILFLAAGFFVSADYRVGAPARLEGAVQRALVAPADGYLEHAHVRPGDQVSAGQVLVELAREDLELEHRKWQSELAQHENAAPAALARGDRSEFVISQALADEARAKLGLVEEQMARANVRSPFDGVVIIGDLSQSLGAPVRRGDMLVTVAPVNEFRLILEVDERDIADITIGQTGDLALGAIPGRNFEFDVTRISPVAAARDGRNFFEVECELDESLVSMRPGLHGVARISVDQRPLVWVLTHRLIDWMRIATWSVGI